MRQRNLLKSILLTGLGLLSVSSAMAQEPRDTALLGNLGGARLVVTEPVTITGLKKVKYADWGSPASPVITGAVVEKAYDTIGAATLLNGTGPYPALTGKFALIYRGGGISFSDKVNRCISKGAVGVIVVNNIPGDPVGMAATPTGSTVGIPVMMVSDVDGQAISNQIKSGVTVKITLGTWNTGATHDLGILTSFQNVPHALNIPWHQVTGAGTPEAFKHYVGGAVANYGTVTETGIAVVDSVFWTPTSGGTSYLTSNTYNIASIAVLDSARMGFGTTSYSLAAPAGTGRYDFRHTLTYSGTDEVPQDNVATISQYISDSIYCKGNYDYANHRPRTTLGIRPGTASPITFTMGNMFYIKNGGYAARHLQFILSVNDAPTLNGMAAFAYIYKWSDGAVAKDSFVQAGELTTVGQAAINFTTADSSGETFTVKFVDIADPESDKPIILDDDSWYYAAVEVPAPCFIGVDQGNSFFSRCYAQWKNGGSKPGAGVYDVPLGLWTAEVADFLGTADNSLSPYPFCLANPFAIDSIFYDQFTSLPALGLLMSKEKPIVSIGGTPSRNVGQINVFPNPADNGTVNVDVNLNAKARKVEYKLTDMLGRTLQSEVHYEVTAEKFQMNTAKYPSGNYYLMILADDVLTNRKITIRN